MSTRFNLGKTLFLLLFFISSISFSQEKWEFANSTPRETVKSHLYFLDRSHYDPEIASYALGGDLPQKEKITLAIKLKDIILKHKLNIDDVLNKRKAIISRNKYILFPDIPEIYLVRIDKKWVYSEETVSSINKIYKNYYLSIDKENDFQSELKKVIKQKHVIHKKNDDTTNTNIDDAEYEEEIELDLSTPYNTIISHLIFLDDSLYRPDLAAKTINFSGTDTLYAEELAVKLKQIYLGSNTHVFDINEISTDTNFIDSTSQKHIYFPNPNYPELYLEKVGDKWLYSNSTSKLINSVHKDMYSEDAEQIFSFSDKFKRWAGVESKTYIYKLKLWQIYMFLYFFIIWLTLFMTCVFPIKYIVMRILKNSRYNKIIYKLIRVFILTVFWYSTRSYLPAFGLSMEQMSALHKFVNVLIIFNVTLLSMYIVDFLKIRFTNDMVATSTKGLIIFMSLIVKTIIFITSLLLLIKALDFNLVNVLAGLSIGGFALALGAQDTIKNFFGSLMIFADKQFSVGDYINSDNISGTVEEVGLRTTKIRTFHNSVVVVPNSKLADGSIDNMGRRKFRRYKGVFVIKFETPTEKIEKLIEKIKEEISKREDTRKDFYMVYMNDFSVYGMEILVYVFFKVPDWEMEMKGKHELIKKILDFANELDIEFAIPPK